MLPDTDTESAMTAAEKLRLVIAAIDVPGVPRAITASFGIAKMPADGAEPSSLRGRCKRGDSGVSHGRLSA